MRTNEIFIAFVASPVVCTFVSYCFGFLILKGLKIGTDKTFMPLASLLIGVLIINVLMALVLTKLSTVQLLLIPLLLLLLINAKKDLSTRYDWQSFRSGFSVLVIFLGIWIVFYFGAYFSFLFDDEKAQTLYLDIYYFVRIAENIWLHGQENIMNTLNQMDSFSGGTTNYHYVELYQTLLLSKPFGLNSLWGFSISLPIFFSVIGSFSIYTLLRSSNSKFNPGLIIFGSFMALFLSGYNLLPFEYTENGAYSMNLVNNVLPKYFPIFLPLLLAGFFISTKQYFTALITACMVVAFTFTMVPVVLLLGLAGIISLKAFGEIRWPECFKLICILFGSVGFVMVFYKVNSVAPHYQRLDTNYLEVLSGFLKEPFPVIRRWVGTHVYYVLDYFLFLAPFAVFLIYSWKSGSWKKYLRIVGFFLLIFEGGVLATSLLDGYHTQAWQPQYITLTVGSNLFLILLLIQANRYHLTFSKLFASLMLLVCIINFWSAFSNYYIYNDSRMSKYDLSMDFFEEATLLLGNSDKQIIAFIEDEPILPAIYPIGSTLTHINPNLDLECIDQSLMKDLNANYFLCTFREFFRNSSSFDVEVEQLKYILQFEIRYLVGYEENETFHFLKDYSKEILKDEMSGLYLRELNWDQINQDINRPK